MGAYDLTTAANVKSHLGITASTHDTIIAKLIEQVSDLIETYCGRYFKARAYTLEQYDGDALPYLSLRNWPIISVERIAIGTVSALQVECDDSDAYSAAASITRSEGDLPVNTHLKLSIHGGSGAGSTSLAFSTYTTLTTLAAQVNATTGWSASVQGECGSYVSTELVQSGSRECLDSPLVMTVPDQRLDDYTVNYVEGTVYYAGGFPFGFQNIFIDYNGGYTTIPDDIELVAIQVVASVFNSRTLNTSIESERLGDYMYKLGDIKSQIQTHDRDLSLYKRWNFT